MDKKIAIRWVKALRSKKYKQGRGALCRFDHRGENPQYCCLGVLTDIYQKDQHRKGKKVLNSFIKDELLFFGKSNYEVLPHSVIKWAKMKSNYGAFDVMDCDSLSVMNDYGDSFAKIAKLIEKNFDNL